MRGALAAGAASFAGSVATNYTAHLENIKQNADTIAVRVETALPLG